MAKRRVCIFGLECCVFHTLSEYRVFSWLRQSLLATPSHSTGLGASFTMVNVCGGLRWSILVSTIADQRGHSAHEVMKP